MIEARVEKEVIDVLLREEEIKELAEDICNMNSNDQCAPPIIVGISRDLTIAKNQWYVFLAYPDMTSLQSDGIGKRYRRRVQVPIVEFCEELAKQFERKITSVALCFVADASSSLSSKLFVNILRECRKEFEIPTVQEPAWMFTMALLMRKKSISPEICEKILYSLCRLESYRYELAGMIGKRHRTVAFILPGMGCTKVILPVLQKLFPCERHIFAYDGCISSVHRSLFLNNGGAKNDELPVTATPRGVSSSVPLAPLMKDLPSIPTLLSKLDNKTAGVVEAWMSSVDTLICLKDNERSNMYTPFVCRMEYLFMSDSKIDSKQLEERRQLALANVLQYLTGSRSRALDEITMDAAWSVFTDIKKEYDSNVPRYAEVNQALRIAIEDTVFLHKMILLGDKTLPDTVQPRKEWSLKAAKKLTSCACCFPGEDEEEENENETQDVTPDASMTGSFASKRDFVDGKTTFAFDPSVFTGLK